MWGSFFFVFLIVYYNKMTVFTLDVSSPKVLELNLSSFSEPRLWQGLKIISCFNWEQFSHICTFLVIYPRLVRHAQEEATWVNEQCLNRGLNHGWDIVGLCHQVHRDTEWSQKSFTAILIQGYQRLTAPPRPYICWNPDSTRGVSALLQWKHSSYFHYAA